jgi:hypothetical protein
VITAKPFRPYIARSVTGKTYLIGAPELVSCTVDGRQMYIHGEGGLHVLDMERVEALDPAPAQRAG